RPRRRGGVAPRRQPVAEPAARVAPAPPEQLAGARFLAGVAVLDLRLLLARLHPVEGARLQRLALALGGLERRQHRRIAGLGRGPPVADVARVVDAEEGLQP